MTRILDTHFHLWDEREGSYGWVTTAINDGVHFAGAGTLPAVFGSSQAAAEWGATDLVPFVHVEAGANRDAIEAEWEWVRPELDALSVATGSPTVMVVPADLTRPDSVNRALRHAEDPRVVGIRDIVSYSPDPSVTFRQTDPLVDPSWLDGFARMANAGLVFDLQIYPGQAVAAAELARRHPAQRIVIDHTLLPDLADAADVVLWRAALDTLAAEPNVAIKLGGLGMRNPQLSTADAARWLRVAHDAFGSDRAMFGTNAPVELAHRSLVDVAESFQLVLGDLTAKDAQLVAEQSALSWYSRRS